MYRNRTFYSHYGKWFLYLLVIASIAVALRWLVNSPSDWVFATIWAIGGIGFVALLVLVFTVIWCIGVGKDGVRGYDFWGRFRNVSWNEMASVTTRSYLGAPYIVVRCPRLRFTLHITMWLHRLEDFAATVIAFAPSDNPLSMYLSQRFGAGTPPVMSDH